jgi:hypothetical protein
VELGSSSEPHAYLTFLVPQEIRAFVLRDARVEVGRDEDTRHAGGEAASVRAQCQHSLGS